MALALMNEVTRESRDGVSICCGLGNEADVGFGEALEYLGADSGTRAVLAYAEGIRDGRRFLAAAARVTREKPVVLIKAARSVAGAEAARSHTGAVAGPYDRLRAGMAQAGIVEVRRTDELLQVAATLASQPAAPAGTGVAILSDGGGQGTLAVDALSEMGVPLAVLAPGTRDALRSLLGPAAAVANPVDLAGAADADPRVFARALQILASDPEVGCVLVVGLFGGYGIRFSETLTEPEVEAAREMAALAGPAGKGVVVHSMYAPHWSAPLEVLGEARIPVMQSLDVACRCVAELWRRGQFLASRPWTPRMGDTVRKASPVVRAVRSQGREVLTEPEA
ncbi:MAG TPA: hypothetical protein VLA43_16585, partial [Longimicrobiales bacterium]|nr:hypothetical protein [Longimicrobiales bacterium]